jgi:TonB family protein
MRLNAYSRLIIVVVATLILSQCTVPSKMASNELSVAETLKTEDSVYINRDSAQWEMHYAKFLDSIQPVNRTYEKIFPVLQLNKEVIFEALKPFLPNDSTSSKFIHLKITPQGKLLKIFDYLYATSDTQKVNKADSLMDKINFGNSQTGVYHTGISINFDKNKQLFMDNKIVYGHGFGRSRKSVNDSLIIHMVKLRYAYNKFLRNHMNAQGKLEVQFDINSYGNIVSCKVLSSTPGMKGFESEAIKVIRKWKFDPVYTRDDVTRCTYPFVFSTY